MKASESLKKESVVKKFACPECQEDYEPIDKLKSSKKLVKDLKETHSCQIRFTDIETEDMTPGSETPSDKMEATSPQDKPGDSTTLTYDLPGLLYHVEQECPKARTCFNCKMIFDTKEEFAQHLKYACQFIKV